MKLLSAAQYRAMPESTNTEKAAQYLTMSKRYAAEAASWTKFGDYVKERSCIALAVRYHARACKLDPQSAAGIIRVEKIVSLYDVVFEDYDDDDIIETHYTLVPRTGEWIIDGPTDKDRLRAAREAVQVYRETRSLKMEVK